MVKNRYALINAFLLRSTTSISVYRENMKGFIEANYDACQPDNDDQIEENDFLLKNLTVGMLDEIIKMRYFKPSQFKNKDARLLEITKMRDWQKKALPVEDFATEDFEIVE